MSFLDEAQIEIAAIGFFQELGYAYVPGPHIAPGEPSAERCSFCDLVIQGRLNGELRVEDINPRSA